MATVEKMIQRIGTTSQLGERIRSLDSKYITVFRVCGDAELTPRGLRFYDKLKELVASDIEKPSVTLSVNKDGRFGSELWITRESGADAKFPVKITQHIDISGSGKWVNNEIGNFSIIIGTDRPWQSDPNCTYAKIIVTVDNLGVVDMITMGFIPVFPQISSDDQSSMTYMIMKKDQAINAEMRMFHGACGLSSAIGSIEKGPSVNSCAWALFIADDLQPTDEFTSFIADMQGVVINYESVDDTTFAPVLLVSYHGVMENEWFPILRRMGIYKS